MQESLEASVVRLHTVDGHVVGAGFLVGERHILTCAHVVAGALGLADDSPEKPQAPVSLDIPRVAPGQLLTARVVLWRPPRADGSDDIAGLELLDDPPHGAQAAPLAQVEDLWEHSFSAFGFPRGQDTGVWVRGQMLGRQATNWVQIEGVKETGFAVEPGFSGTPVWDPQVEAVVGMVVAAEKRMNLKTAFAIPVDVLVKSWPLLQSLIHPFVFLCYARADSDLVTRLKTDLLDQGIYVWIDREGLQPGTLDWEEALRTAIRAARAVILIASPNARSSRYVRDELRVAEMYLRPVYPLWIAGPQWMDAVPLGWGGAQYIDARESRYETAVSELIGVLNKVSSSPPKLPELDFEPRNPYKGLRAFTGDDCHDFFGRDELINELAAALEEALASEEKNQPCARLLAVVGPSGSGKSSVVMAGLLPHLREGRLPDSEQWVYLNPIVPGSDPIEHLALTLSDHVSYTPLAIQRDLEDDSARGLHLLATKLAKRPGTKVVLLVDQFEELFTQTTSEDERRHFLDLLVTAITEPHGSVIVLLTLRADFYDRPMRYPQLHQLMQAHQTSVLPMAIHELREVIEKPTALPDVRLTFEGDLVGDLLFEVQGQVGALPLLQFTLDQLFKKRSGRQLTLSAYRELGGVKGALTRQAEETYTSLPSEEHRKLAHALFVRLIDPSATEQDTTRRRAALSEFSLPEASQTRLLQDVTDVFIAARLLTTNVIAGTTTIEVSHEALIREWPRLAEWLHEAREDIPLQQTISKDVADWERRSKPRDRLYHGSQLKEARAWARRNTPSGNEVAFLRASATQRLRVLVSMIAIILVLLSSAGIAVRQSLQRTPDPTIVTTDRDDGPGSLRQAIVAASPGSTITFDESLRGKTILTHDTLNITKKLTIRGPGAGNLSIRSDTGAVVEVKNGSVTVIGLTFEGIQAGSSRNDTQRSILINDDTLILTKSTISGSAGGGGIDNSGILTLRDSVISKNKDVGILNAGKITIINSMISDNAGGGIFNWASNSTLTITNSTISGNTASDKGSSYSAPGPIILANSGGIINHGTLTITNSTISSNTASSTYDRCEFGIGRSNSEMLVTNGGGIFNWANSTLTITNSTISGNTASSNYSNFECNSKISRVLVTNSGGIENHGTLTITNSTISGNTASRGSSFNRATFSESGGITNFGGKANIAFCTIYNNTLQGGSRDIFTGNGEDKGGHTISGHVQIRNSIIAGNHTNSPPDISGMLTSNGYNLFQDNPGATFDPTTSTQHSTDRILSVGDLSNLFADPVRLQDNGGPTRTYALAPGSPALDQIPLDSCHVTVPIKNLLGTPIAQYTITTDQRGMKRPDGNEPFCDIGAYEYMDSPS